MPTTIRFIVLCFVAAWPLTAYAAEPTGTWLTGDGQVRIRIARCSAGLCGTIVWLKVPIDPATRRPQVDDKNHDPGKRLRPIMGLQILSMRSASSDTWSGSIYNADDGNTYQVTITPQSATNLVVHGCFGIFCGNDSWTKVGDEHR